MSKLSTGILINKIKLMDKIDCEIETAKKTLKCWGTFGSILNKCNTKIETLQDLKQWIEDLEKEGE